MAQVKEFKDLVQERGKIEEKDGQVEKMDKWIGVASAVMTVSYWTIEVKRESSHKAKHSIYQSIYVLPLIYGHELWVVTERMRFWIQEAKMSFLREVAGLSLRKGTRSGVATPLG